MNTSYRLKVSLPPRENAFHWRDVLKITIKTRVSCVLRARARARAVGDLIDLENERSPLDGERERERKTERKKKKTK